MFQTTRRTVAAWMALLCLTLVLGQPPATAQTPPNPRADDKAYVGEVYVRFKVLEPKASGYQIATGGFRHDGPQWYLPTLKGVSVPGGWTEWFNLSEKQLPKLRARAGGVAEWPAMTATITPVNPANPDSRAVRVQIQIADAPSESSIVIDAVEQSESATIGFLLPHPIRKFKDQFETGSQMVQRHLRWAQEAAAAQTATPTTPAGGAASNQGTPTTQPGAPSLQPSRFQLVTALWGHYDPALERQSLQALKLLGINAVGNASVPALREAGMKTYGHTWIYDPSPEDAARAWSQYVKTTLNRELQTDDGKWKADNLIHYTISDETQALDLGQIDRNLLAGWFRGYLSAAGLKTGELPSSLESTFFPAADLKAKALRRDADLPTRRLLYHAARFNQWWSAKQLKHTSELIRATFPSALTQTLPSDHAFFNAWGAPHVGMGYRALNLIELGRMHAVDILAAEDWLGLNHMYGPRYTWSGGQSFGYLSAILRSGMTEFPTMQLMGLLTPSDDKYLRLKAYSNIGQGSKTLFYWTFGPTYISTENYWSDLRSMYDGVATISADLSRAEHVLFDAKPVRDPVAILYSVSHDLWHTEDPASFVENRLLWHGLRHVQVQPDFITEEDVADGKLKDYKVLFITGQTLTRKAAQVISRWVKTGGVVFLTAGAATRDEYFEPAIPGFVADLWAPDAAMAMTREKHDYNERVDLPIIPPMDHALLDLPEGRVRLPVLGGKLVIPEPRKGIWGPSATVISRFESGGIASAWAKRGAGHVYVNGFFPMLAYGQLAGFKPTELREAWPSGPRALLRMPLKQGRIQPVAEADRDVVEVNLLTGPNGSCLVLANYTYIPQEQLVITVRIKHPVTQARSTRGSPVKILEHLKDGGVRIQVPLDTADIIVLEP